MSIKNPVFSIIIPTYNSQLTLENTLKSIAYQTFKDFEVLVIDNQSYDNTLDIASSYNKKIDNLRVYSQADNGIYYAMNFGVELAAGDWIFFLGSDDIFYNYNTLETLSTTIANTNKPQVIYGNVFFQPYNRVFDFEFNYFKITKTNICHQAIFFKKEVFKHVGKFNTKYKILADWDHNMRWFFSNKITHIYTNQIIANFAAGGHSSKHKDTVFENVKFYKIIRLGCFKLTLPQLIETCNSAINFYKIKDNLLSFNVFRGVKLVLLLVRKANFFFNKLS